MEIVQDCPGIVGVEQIKHVRGQHAIRGPVAGRQRQRTIDQDSVGAAPPGGEPIGGQSDHDRADVDTVVVDARGQGLQQSRRQPARTAAELKDRLVRAQSRMGHEPVSGRVLKEGLPILGASNRVIDPTSLIRGESHEDAPSSRRHRQR